MTDICPNTRLYTKCKKTGKGTYLDYQIACDANGDAVFDPNGNWVKLGCIYTFTPPAITYDSVTADVCLNDEDYLVSLTELGDLQEDNPAFTYPFCPCDSVYDFIAEAAECAVCLLFRATFPSILDDNGDPCFIGWFGQIKTHTPQEITRTEFMKTEVTLIRKSPIYRGDLELISQGGRFPIPANFDCVSCLPPNLAPSTTPNPDPDPT